MRNLDGPMVLRRIRLADLDDVYDLARAAGSGMTNLPPDRAALAERISASLEAPGACGLTSIVMFVLDVGGRPAGVAAIWPRIGLDRPFYSYRIADEAAASAAYGLSARTRTLTLCTEFTGAAEVGGLLIDPSLRGCSAGRLAARARYLFIAEHRRAFPGRIMAELRGWQDADGVSPVWEALGRCFYGLSFEAADRLSTCAHDFIAEMAPRHPIYVDLLAPHVRAAIGRPHDEARAALKLLREEGFEEPGFVDVFDGGPTVCATLDQVRTIRESRRARVVDIGELGPQAEQHLVCTGRGQAFRASRGAMGASDGGVALAPPLAQALGVGVGDKVRHVAF